MLKRVTVTLSASILCNNSSGAIGIIHNEDGHYTKGLYDALLPIEDPIRGCSIQDPIGWEHVAGYYVGPRRCIVFKAPFDNYRRVGGLDGGSTGRQGWFRASYGRLDAYVYVSGDSRCTAS